MDAYRLYFIGERGEPLSRFVFACDNDLQAANRARQFGCERGADLWCGSRLVGSWRALSPASAERPAGQW